MRRAHVAALLLILTLAACGTSSSSTPAASVTPTPSAISMSVFTAAASAESAAPEPSRRRWRRPRRGLWPCRLDRHGAVPAGRRQPGAPLTCAKAPKPPDGAYDGIERHPAGSHRSAGTPSTPARGRASSISTVWPSTRSSPTRVTEDVLARMSTPRAMRDTNCASAATSTRTGWPMRGCFPGGGDRTERVRRGGRQDRRLR